MRDRVPDFTSIKNDSSAPAELPKVQKVIYFSFSADKNYEVSLDFHLIYIELSLDFRFTYIGLSSDFTGLSLDFHLVSLDFHWVS